MRSRWLPARKAQEIARRRSALFPERSQAPCTSDPALFDDVDLDAHKAARRLCLSCPVQAECRGLALNDPAATGTHGGDLFEDGRVSVHLGVA